MTGKELDVLVCGPAGSNQHDREMGRAETECLLNLTVSDLGQSPKGRSRSILRTTSSVPRDPDVSQLPLHLDLSLLGLLDNRVDPLYLAWINIEIDTLPPTPPRPTHWALLLWQADLGLGP